MSRVETAQGSSTLSSLLRQSLWYLRPYRRQGGFVLLTLLVDVAFNLTFSFSIKVLIDNAVAHQSEGTLAPILAGLTGFFVVTLVARIERDYLSADVEAKLGNDLRLTLLQHLQQLSVEFYGRAKMGDLVTRFSTDVTLIKTALTRAFPTIVHRVIQIVGCLVFLLLLNWPLTALTLVVLSLSLVVPRSVVTRSIRANDRQARAEAATAAEVQEQLSGSTVVRAFALEDVMVGLLAQHLEEVARETVPASRLSRLIRTISGMGITFTTLSITAIGVVLVFHGQLSVGSLVGFVGALNLLSQAAFRMIEAVPEWLGAASGIRRFEEILAEEPRILDAPDAVRLPPITGEIRFSDVHFRYRSDAPTLEDANFTVEAGQSVALVGRSGSGKSTILSLLMRLYDPVRGSITVDSYDVRMVTQESLRAQIGVVFQESFLFNRSIRENIRLGRPSASDLEVEEAARAAQIHEVICRMPNGYETEAGERGGNLSGGQRQRVALARALLRDPAVLVLDEATSALDPATEAAFVETLERLRHGRTIVSVTHRLSAITESDRIFVLNGGRIVEQGTHEDLVDRNGAYRKLWDQQTGFQVSADGQWARVTPARLRQIPLFASADDAVLAALAGQFVSQRCYPGEVIIREGDVADTFFIVVRGSVEVLKTGPDGQEQLLSVRDDGDFLGEIGLLHNIARTATVRALTPALLLVLARRQFEDLLSAAPGLYAVLQREASERLQNEPTASPAVGE